MRQCAAVRMTLLAAAVIILLVGWSGASGAATTTPELATGAAAARSGPATYYSFRSPNPEGGFCEQQVFGPRPVIAEPINAFFCLITVALGLLGVFRSKRTTMAFQFLYGLLAAYGLFATLYHATLMNGFYRMKDVAISMVQSFIIIMLFHSLYLYRVKQRGREAGRGYRVLVSIMTVVFTAYPAAVHVAGESSANAWVAWLVFDLLWALIATQLILIWRRRSTWPKTPANAPVFRLVWYGIGATVLAYAGWSADKFLCSAQRPALAYLALHGVWHLFMGLSFYYLITLSRFFSAHEYGFVPVVEPVPARGFLHLPFFRLPFVQLPFVEWQSRRDAGDDVAFRKSPAPAPTRIPAPRPKRA